MSPWHRAFRLVAAFTFVSRLLGYVRDALLAAVLGTSPAAVALMLALRLTNQMRAILAEGAFTAAFQPLDAAFPSDSPVGDAFRAEVLGWLLLINLCLLGAVLWRPDWLLSLFAPGYAPEDPVYTIARSLLTITFPYLTCMSLVAYFGARLGTRGRFATFAVGPSLLNGCIIAGLLVEMQTSATGHAAAWSVFVAGVLQVALLIYAVQKAGLPLLWPKFGLGRAASRFFKTLVPAVLGAGALQIAVMLDTALASLLHGGALAHLYFADRLYQLPIGLVSVALGTVLLPEVARRHVNGSLGAPHQPIVQALALCAACGLPLTLIFGVAGKSIISALFERGTFSAADTHATAQILAGYALGLVPALMIRPLVVLFQAQGDTRTPFLLLLISLGVNLGCKLALIDRFGAAALGLGTSAGMMAYAVLLASLAWRRASSSSAMKLFA
ncbi:murein biosynthesis integral membrane protein MurJ [Thioclava sp. F36-7]|nr:murein biosynthesis integral membrane protein MurJ [Thioclava sp. F36-7]